MKKIAASAAALAIAITGFAGVPAAQAAGTTLTYGVIADIKSFEVEVAENGNRAPFYQAVYDTLLYKQPNGTLIPGLAVSVKADKSGKVITAMLRKGITFTNGEAFNAAAVAKNIMAFKNGSGVGAALASSLLSAKAKNATTVVFTLKELDPAFIGNLSGPMGMVQAPSTIGTAAAKTNPVGTGPYMVDTAATVTGSTYVFKSNPKYWNKSRRHFDNLIVKVITDQTAQVNALKAGQIDAINLNDKTAVASLKAAGFKFSTQQLDWSGLTLVDKGGRMGTPLKNVKVRQAINYAFDRKAAVQVMGNGFGVATNQIFASYNKAYVKALENSYPYDVAKAKQLMKEAGYENGFELSMPSLSALSATTWQFMKDQLAQINITVKYSDVPLTEFFTQILTPKFPAFWMQLERNSDDWALLKFMVNRDSIWNPSGYGDATADALIEKIRASSGPAQTKLLQQLNTHMVKEAWHVPLYAVDMQFAYNSKVKVQTQAGNAVPFLYNIRPA